MNAIELRFNTVRDLCFKLQEVCDCYTETAALTTHEIYAAFQLTTMTLVKSANISVAEQAAICSWLEEIAELARREQIQRN